MAHSEDHRWAGFCWFPGRVTGTGRVGSGSGYPTPDDQPTYIFGSPATFTIIDCHYEMQRSCKYRSKEKKTKRVRVNDNDSTDNDSAPDSPNSTATDNEDEDDEDVELEDVTEQKKPLKKSLTGVVTEQEIACRKLTVYAFFDAEPELQFGKDGTTVDYLVFTCTQCRTKIKQGRHTSDKGLTGNLTNHAKKCWGDEAVNAAKDSSLDKAWAAVKTFGIKSQTKLTAALKTTKGWAKTFSTRPPEKELIRAMTACWVAENARPFRTVLDRSYQWLQKEGRPNHYVPGKDTVVRNVKRLYQATKAKQADELQTTNTGEADVPGEHAAPENIGLDELYAELKNIEEFGEQDKDNIEGFVAMLDEMTEDISKITSGLESHTPPFPTDHSEHFGEKVWITPDRYSGKSS
ncbi:hypothetical protein FB446DRAFT_708378 [Lentinula raphanica]|nr:hypothetical protein FB446DRAFT_708378 [Lentinula raphanica]